MKLSFYESAACTTRLFCRQCRARVEGMKFRPTWAANHEVAGGLTDFPCLPLGLVFDDEPGAAAQVFPEPVTEPVPMAPYEAPAEPTQIPFKRRNRATMGMAVAWAIAAAAGRWAARETVLARDAICAGCEYQRQDDRGRYCDKCGCGTYSEHKSLKNLAAYEENLPGHPGYNPVLPKWGCKHPQRGRVDASGRVKGWPLPVLPNAPNGNIASPRQAVDNAGRATKAG